MEVREWATRILGADTMEEKLLDPSELTDNKPGPSKVWDQPCRPAGMEFTRRGQGEKLPPFHSHADADKRAICLHRFAGHELLAVEIMAHALVAFPDAPKNFRRGLVHTLKDEQRHVRLYMEQMQRLGLEFGDLPLFKHFWSHVKYLTSPIRYVSTMCLTFEMANLDFAPMYGQSFARYGDSESAELMATILRDEISHVGFGMAWLKRWQKDGESSWDAFVRSQSDLLTPARAKGFVLHEDHRRAAGVPEAWIEHLRQL
jgi:uncharacterized ferritin-like protein (DUF455 family)